MNDSLYPEMMTLQEVCEYFRVEKKVLLRYGLERLGGVRLGPRSWRFPRNEVMKNGVQKPEQKQREIPLDGAKVHQWQEGKEVLRDTQASSTMGNRKADKSGGAKGAIDPYNLLAGMGE